LLADAFEAVIAAIYLDGGLEEAKKFVYNKMDNLINQCAKGKVAMDYKTQLQEIIQGMGDSKITYEICEERGPDHNKVFVKQGLIAGEPAGKGDGRSKKEADQNAAKEALKKDWKNIKNM
ncbi:ribonuclease III, partial [Escherichia coli]|uniref:ribonuclease III family protein n=1 Tax=Escherichia coli TaxID=562 RepID=UPI00110193E2